MAAVLVLKTRYIACCYPTFGIARFLVASSDCVVWCATFAPKNLAILAKTAEKLQCFYWGLIFHCDTLLCCGVTRLIVRLICLQMGKAARVTLTSLGRVSVLRVFFHFKPSKCWFALVASSEGFRRPCDSSTQGILPLLRTITNEAERSLYSPRQWSSQVSPSSLMFCSCTGYLCIWHSGKAWGRGGGF